MFRKLFRWPKAKWMAEDTIKHLTDPLQRRENKNKQIPVRNADGDRCFRIARF